VLSSPRFEVVLGRAGTAALAALGGCVLGACTVLSPQLGATVALVGAVVLAYLASPSLGLVSLWSLWLIAPGVRRVFGLFGSYVSIDPLSAAPFVATAAIAGIQVARSRLDAETKRVLCLAFLGLAVGIPAGASNPAAMIYALIAYGGGVLAYVIGRSEQVGSFEALSLRKTLVIAAPLLAAYGIAQYFLPLTEWDQRWLQSVDFTSIGAPEDGKIRVFSTLNAPGTLAPILALALLCYLASNRVRVAVLVSTVVAFVAFALTYARGTWVAFAVAALVMMLLAPTRSGRAIFGLCTLLVLVTMALGSSTPTTRAFSHRLETFGSLGSDTSANARTSLPLQIVPHAVTRPFGAGLGSAGEATKLGTAGPLTSPDNGYLSMLYQLGPAGALLLFAAVFAPLRAITRRVVVQGARDRQSVVLFSMCVFMVVLLIGGDLFYGVTGVILWYLLGRAMAVSRPQRADVLQATPLEHR
jgi:O-Antigen ligase